MASPVYAPPDGYDKVGGFPVNRDSDATQRILPSKWLFGHAWTRETGKTLQNQRHSWWQNGFEGCDCGNFKESIWRTIHHMIVEGKVYSQIVRQKPLVEHESLTVNPINDREPPFQDLTLTATAKGAGVPVAKTPRYKSPLKKKDADEGW